MNRMMTATIFSLLASILGGAGASAQRRNISDEAMREQVERLVAPLVQSGTIVGASIGLVDGEKSWSFGFGYTSSARNARPDGTTIFEIGSVTKTFTGILLADAVERGKVKLQDPVGLHLPDSLRTRPIGSAPITLLDLATHHSGLPSIPENFDPGDPANPFVDYTAARMIDYLASYSPAQTKTGSYDYSNLGAGLLGWILSSRSGIEYGELVRRRIIAPLGMGSTSVAVTPEMAGRMSTGHDADGNAVPNWDFAALAGAGAIRSNVEDMLLYLKANLGATRTSIRTAIDNAQKPQRSIDGGSIGLGWHILPDRKVIWHNGETGGYHSLVAFNREKRQAVVVLANTASSHIDQLGFDLLRMLGGETPAPIAIPTIARFDTATLERYVGVYRFAPAITMTITRDRDRLNATLSGQQPFRIYPTSESEFFYRAVDARLTFERGADGRIEQLVLHQGGAEMKARRE